MNRGEFKLILFDVDSTLIQQEVIDLLAQRTPYGDKVRDITHRAMAGEIDFNQALIERVTLLEGLSESIFDEVIDELSFTPGAIDLISELRNRGFRIGAVSGGFINILSKFFANLNLDYLRANNLEVLDGKLTGKVHGEIVNRVVKREALFEFARNSKIDITQTIAVGDGANDLDMITSAGLGVSYRGKAILNEAADVVITDERLDNLLKFI